MSSGEIPQHLKQMTRTPSTKSVLTREAAYNMDAIIDQGRGWIEVMAF